MQAGQRTLTEREAYLAMLVFLDAYWERGNRKSDDLADLLGSAALQDGGMPFDQALWDDWVESVDVVVSEQA